MLNVLYIFFLLGAGATALITIMSLPCEDMFEPISWAIVSFTWYFAAYCISKRLVS